jgi:hypothetical protein
MQQDGKESEARTMKFARVFTARNKATPVDDLAFVGGPDLLTDRDIDEVHISVTFTWHKRLAEQFAEQWAKVAPVTIGGPTYDDPGGEFVPGRYLRRGYVITSRGCPSRCPHCFVPRREGPLRELPIVEGWNILDNNLLACSRPHVEAVFAMAARQKRPQDVSPKSSWRVAFTGGFEAARLDDWHVDRLALIRPRPTVFFAYDLPADYEPLVIAARKMVAAGWSPKRKDVLRAYVLIGYLGDTLEAAKERLDDTVRLGFTPMAMLYRDVLDTPWPHEWRRLQRIWARPALMPKANVED